MMSQPKNAITKSILCLCLLSFSSSGFCQDLWQPFSGQSVPSKGMQQIIPKQYKVTELNKNNLTTFLQKVGNSPDNAIIINLPEPNGGKQSFKIWRNTLLSSGLQKEYPQIQTFTAVATKNAFITAKIDYTPKGFHAMVFSPGNTWMIDPYSNQNDGYYIVYNQNDAPNLSSQKTICQVNEKNRNELEVVGTATNIQATTNAPVSQKPSDNIKRKYRLALSCTGEYAQAVGGVIPTKGSVLAAMVTTMNRVNGIYERELNVTMQLIDKEDSLIYLNPTTDPFTANNSGGQLLGQNQNNTDNILADSDYDIGHIFSTGGGGIASLGSVCYQHYKAKGVTGLANPVGDAFSVDYVAHEMGHQFGGNHAFNDCNGNEYWRTAYEPGSGSTIMCYAGICGAQNNIQEHSDAYFHAISLTEIGDFLSGFGGSCATTSNLQVVIPTIPSIQKNYIIPAATPFELIAPTITSFTPQDSLSYCWEQWNLGNFQEPEVNGASFTSGPTFRSANPKVNNGTRIFPDIEHLLSNQNQTAGERLPLVDRNMYFKLTVRNIDNGWGSFQISNDSMSVQVVNTNAPFKVNFPSSSGLNFKADSTITITWDLAGTQNAPINCAFVDIFLSTDGGYTYSNPIQNIPNNGQAVITLPNVNTTKARIKVKGHDNIFFDISNNNFTIDGATGISNIAFGKSLDIFPNPATNNLHIVSQSSDKISIQFINSIGQTIWSGGFKRAFTLNTEQFPRGIYLIKLEDNSHATQFVKKIILK